MCHGGFIFNGLLNKNRRRISPAPRGDTQNRTGDKGFAGTYYTFFPSLFYMALLYCIPVQARFVCKLNAYSNPFFCILRNVGLIPLNTGETS